MLVLNKAAGVPKPEWWKLLKNDNIHLPSVAKIAARTDVAVGILNYHFGSRRELLRELMAAQAGEFIARLTAPTDADSFFDYEQAILAIYLTFLHANPTTSACRKRYGYTIPVFTTIRT